MTGLLEQAISKASQLTQEGQDAIASIILQEIESEERWEELFARPGSAEMLSRMADKALEDVRAGRARPLELDDL
jgi:transposase-like protein